MELIAVTPAGLFLYFLGASWWKDARRARQLSRPVGNTIWCPNCALLRRITADPDRICCAVSGRAAGVSPSS